MVTTTMRGALVLTWLLAMTAVADAQQQPSRLMVSNQTTATVELFTLVNNKWQSHSRINRGASTSVYNVTNGQRFRATWGSSAVEHTVKLAFNRDYGGLQDFFTVK